MGKVIGLSAALMLAASVGLHAQGKPLPQPAPLTSEVRAEIWKDRASLAQMAMEFERLQAQMNLLRTKYQEIEGALKNRLQELQADAPGYELDEKRAWRKKGVGKAGGARTPVGG